MVDFFWVWICEQCGWEWPLPGDPPDDAECDNCGCWLYKHRSDEL